MFVAVLLGISLSCFIVPAMHQIAPKIFKRRLTLFDLSTTIPAFAAHHFLRCAILLQHEVSPISV